jgi:hypothetical protein
MRWVVAGMLVFAVVACGSRTAKPEVSRDGRAVLRDAYDGRLDHNWSCASLRAAYRRLPSSPPMYSKVPQLIGDSAARACRAS